MNNKSRVEIIRGCLENTLSPQSLEIIDDSHKHIGHAGAQGGGHFTVNIVAEAFAGKSLIEKHRMIYSAVDELMKTEIHALSINAKEA